MDWNCGYHTWAQSDNSYLVISCFLFFLLLYFSFCTFKYFIIVYLFLFNQYTNVPNVGLIKAFLSILCYCLMSLQLLQIRWRRREPWWGEWVNEPSVFGSELSNTTQTVAPHTNKDQKKTTLCNGGSRPWCRVYMHKWRLTWWKNNSKFKNQQPTLPCKLLRHAMLHAAVAASQPVSRDLELGWRRGMLTDVGIKKWNSLDVMWGPLKRRARLENHSRANGPGEKQKQKTKAALLGLVLDLPSGWWWWGVGGGGVGGV